MGKSTIERDSLKKKLASVSMTVAEPDKLSNGISSGCCDELGKFAHESCLETDSTEQQKCRGFVDVYGDNGRASACIKKSSIRLQDVHELISWVLGDGINPAWVYTENKPLIQQVVMIAIPGMDCALQTRHKEQMPFVKSSLGARVECRLDDGKAPYGQSMDRLLTLPATKAQKKQMKKHKNDPKPPEFFALSMEKMQRLNYPLPVATSDGSFEAPPDFAWTSRESFDNAGSLPSRPGSPPANNFQDEETTRSSVQVQSSDALSQSKHQEKTSGDGDKSSETQAPQTAMNERPSDHSMYSLDCEMSYTADGLEITRVSVVNYSGKVVLDELVLPDKPVVDWNTRYSGITEEMMEGVTTRVSDVVARLQGILTPTSFLVGHSLENDLKALKFLHGRILDTVDLYPHPRGLPYRRALRNLSQQYLHRTIQSNTHNSIEDARAAMDLVRLKLKVGPAFGSPDVSTLRQFGTPIPEALSEKGRHCCFIDRIHMLRKHITNSSSSGIVVETDAEAVCAHSGCMDNHLLF